MPHPRGGPCDNNSGLTAAYWEHAFLCRILAAVPATKQKRVPRRVAMRSFYAASSRRSLRLSQKGFGVTLNFVSMPHPRGGPCDSMPKYAKEFGHFVSMPHPRGGPCD